MRKFFIFFIFISVKLFSQDLNNNRIGVSYIPVSTKCYTFEDLSLEDEYYKGLSGKTLGIYYVRSFYSSNFQLETGINYSKLYIYISEEIPIYNVNQSRKEQRNLLSIPVGLVLKSKEGLFISIGTQIDMELNTWTKLHVDSQNGIGFYISPGFSFRLIENVYFSIAPIIKAHAIIPFSKETNHQRLFDYGIKFELAYGFFK